jgi:hypothetical protein
VPHPTLFRSETSGYVFFFFFFFFSSSSSSRLRGFIQEIVATYPVASISCKTAMETVPFCFRNQHKSLAQSITSPHTGNSFTLYSLYTLLQITTAVRAFQKSPTKLPVQRQTSASPKKVKIVCFQTSISLTPEAYKSFNVPIRKRIKLQPASQVF